MFHQGSHSVGCNFLDDVTAALGIPQTRIALGFLLLQRGVLLLLELLDAKGFVGLPFLLLFKDDGQKIQTDAVFIGYCVFCVSRVKTLRLLVVWVAGDRSKVANNKSDLATAGRHQ